MIIHEPFFTSSIGGDTIKTNFSGSAYIGFGATSSHATASNEFVIGYNISGSGNNTVNIADKIRVAENEITTISNIVKANISGSYIGYGANSSSAYASNEFVVGNSITGSGANTITLGNESTTETHLFGSIYRTQFVTSSITASKFKAYALSGSNYTFHLPASPNPGDSLKISNFQTNATGSNRYSTQILSGSRITIGRSGEAIMGITESMELDYQSPTFEIMYIDSTRGWVIFGGN
jgi:hypothetical protein